MAKRSRKFWIAAALGGLVGTVACATVGGLMLAKTTEQWEPVPPLVAPALVPGEPPADALVLFDGTGLNQWVNQRDGSAASWTVADGAVTVNKQTGNIATRRKFGSFQLHLEWRVPVGITGEGQARGNSGVFLAAPGTGDAGYEVQILDGWNNSTYVNGQAGAVYKQHPPLANPARPPGQWNVYDIAWTAPTFTAEGKLKSPARVTVLFNGVLVQNNAELKGQTKFICWPSYSAHGPAPIMLQAHGDPSAPIGFRNIWIRPLD
jgi:hypothetical protein